MWKCCQCNEGPLPLIDPSCVICGHRRCNECSDSSSLDLRQPEWKVGDARAKTEVADRPFSLQFSQLSMNEEPQKGKARADREQETGQRTGAPAQSDESTPMLQELKKAAAAMERQTKSENEVFSSNSRKEPQNETGGLGGQGIGQEMDTSAASPIRIGPHTHRSRDYATGTMAQVNHAVERLRDGSLGPNYFRDDLIMVAFVVNWELLQFIRDDYWDEVMLGPALTVVGENSGSNAWAGSCEQYVKETWGMRGLAFLEELQHALDNVHPRLADRGVASSSALPRRRVFHMSAINFRMLGVPTSPTVVEFKGEVEEVCVLGQFLSWITATFRRPHRNRLSTSAVDFAFEYRQSPTFSIQLLPLEVVNTDVNPGSCWHPLFPSTVMATGFPIAPRPEGTTGIQLSYDVMLDLSRVFYHVDLQEANNHTEGIFFKGLNCMLFPTRCADEDVIQWHYIDNVALSDLGKHDTPDILVPFQTWLRVRSLDTLRSATAILGYCGHGIVRLGTEDRTRLYAGFESSLTTKETPGPEVSMGVGTLQVNGMGFGSAQVGGKVRYRRGLADAMLSAEEITYQELLDNAKDPIILFETAPRLQKAWLVPRLSVILDLVNNWAHQYKDMDQTIEYAEAMPDGAEAVKAVLKRPKYSQLVLANGDSDSDRVRVSDLVRRFYGQMQRRELMAAHSERGAKGTIEFGRKHLAGWDLKELISPPSVVHRRQFSQRLHAAWTPITEVVPVYFGQGLGELISPRQAGDLCNACKSYMTEGGMKNNSLITTVWCIHAISKQHGFNDCCVVSDNLLWRFKDDSIFYQCGTGSMSCPKKFQILVSGKHRLTSFRSRRPDGTYYPQISRDGIIAFRDSKSRW